MALAKLTNPDYLREVEINLAQGVWKDQNEPFVRFLRNNALEEPEHERRRQRLLARLALAGVITEPASEGREEYHGIVGKEERYDPLSLAVERGSCALWTSIKKKIKVYAHFNTKGRIHKIRCRAARIDHDRPTPIEDIAYIAFESNNVAWTNQTFKVQTPQYNPELYREVCLISQDAHLGINLVSLTLQRSQRLARGLADAIWAGTMKNPTGASSGVSGKID